ncbi:phosphate uptake regulator PhoU [Patescibacteria group bacterium]|nr:phosphate uptake regulator PhoU [Patescibacteria group bacterium]
MSIFDFFTKESLLNQVIGEIDQMFEKNKKMFKAVTDFLLENKKMELDISQEDKELNIFEISIRKKIFEHLSINPSKDLAFSLIIIDVARDTERIGDFCKNLYKLAIHFQTLPSDNKYWAEINEMKNYIGSLIDEVYTAFKKPDKELANKAIGNYREKINQRVIELQNKVAADDSLSSQEALVLALTSRFLRRITAHLINIATSVVNEFPKMRYTKNYNDV